MEAELQNFKSHSILCAKAELRDLKPKLFVWKWNCRTSSRSIFLVWKRNYGTSKYYSVCGSGVSGLKFTQHSMCRSGTAELKVSVETELIMCRTECALDVHMKCTPFVKD